MHAWQDLTERAQPQMLFVLNSDFSSPVSFPSLPETPFLPGLLPPPTTSQFTTPPCPPSSPLASNCWLSGFDNFRAELQAIRRLWAPELSWGCCLVGGLGPRPLHKTTHTKPALPPMPVLVTTWYARPLRWHPHSLYRLGHLFRNGSDLCCLAQGYLC